MGRANIALDKSHPDKGKRQPPSFYSLFIFPEAMIKSTYFCFFSGSTF